MFGLLLVTVFAAGCTSTAKTDVGKLWGFGMPPTGKSKVVFIRPSSEGKAIDFGVHDGERLIGRSLSSTYFVYECDPGQHVFSSSFGNLAILYADLLPDRIYYVNVQGQLKAFSPVWVKLDALYPGCAAIKWEKISNILTKLKETTITSSEVEHDLTGVEKYKERMKKYENDAQPDPRILPEYGQTNPILAQ